MQNTSLPFAHLNLRFNPFGELDRTRRTELAVAEVNPLVPRLKQPGFAVQFIDEKGRGKTSHMLAIHRYFKSAPYIRVDEGEGRSIPNGHPLFLDELQRIPKWRRKIIFRRPVSFVIGSHRDHTSELRKAGVVSRTIIPGDSVCQERMCLIFQRRIELARRSSGPVPRVPHQTIQRLIGLCGRDVRGMESILYEAFQNLKEVGDVNL